MLPWARSRRSAAAAIIAARSSPSSKTKTSSGVSERSASRPRQHIGEFTHCASRDAGACPIRRDADRAAPRSASGSVLHKSGELGRLIEVERDRIVADHGWLQAERAGSVEVGKEAVGTKPQRHQIGGRAHNRIGAALVPGRRDGECRAAGVRRQRPATSAAATRGISPGMVNMADPLAASRCAAAVTAPV